MSIFPYRGLVFLARGLSEESVKKAGRNVDILVVPLEVGHLGHHIGCHGRPQWVVRGTCSRCVWLERLRRIVP